MCFARILKEGCRYYRTRRKFESNVANNVERGDGQGRARTLLLATWTGGNL